MSGKEGVIYYIGCTETKRVKIGFTSGDPIARLKSLQTGSASRLNFLALEYGDADREKDLHRRFDSCRVRGEWFEPNDDLIKHMCLVCLVVAADCLEHGEEIDEWAITGLKVFRTFDLIPDYEWLPA